MLTKSHKTELLVIVHNQWCVKVYSQLQRCPVCIPGEVALCMACESSDLPALFLLPSLSGEYFSGPNFLFSLCFWLAGQHLRALLPLRLVVELPLQRLFSVCVTSTLRWTRLNERSWSLQNTTLNEIRHRWLAAGTVEDGLSLSAAFLNCYIAPRKAGSSQEATYFSTSSSDCVRLGGYSDNEER